MKDTKFKTGNPGRRPGSKNKSLTRGRIIAILSKEENWQRFEKELQAMKGRAYCEAFMRMWEFDTPKWSAISFSLSNMSEPDLQFLIDKIKNQVNDESESGID